MSGLTSYILTNRVAPLIQSFYFTNRSLSSDARYLWFYCTHPPAASAELGRTLGVADFLEGTVQWFPETQFRDASPFIEPDTAEVFWCSGFDVYRRAPQVGAKIELINGIPESIHHNRYGKRLATHLTLSSDRREFLIDAHFGREWCIGSLPLDGSEFQVWKTFDRCYNHAQFSPTNPDLALIAQDGWIDVASGKAHGYENRIWLLNRNGKMQPLFSDAASLTHEWWDPDGQHIWYVDYNRGTEKINIHTGTVTNVWPAGTCHSHSNADGRYLVGDIGTYSQEMKPARVRFLNTVTGREIDIVTALPLPPYNRATYHIDPHPQFCAGDLLIAYTTTVMGRVDIALIKTSDLIEATGG